MVKVITIADLQAIIREIGLKTFFLGLIDQLRIEFERWDVFEKSPRHATHFAHGVMELMPICGPDYYAFKYVNGHPQNPKDNKLTVVATGMLAEVETGYPILLSEMTLLTAFRTAATAALAAHYLARKNVGKMGLIGTGSQAEFLTLAHYFSLDVSSVRYFDVDPNAMTKYQNALSDFDLNLEPVRSIEEAIADVDLVITATANKDRLTLLHRNMIVDGMHVTGIGGDCPGKTELDADILRDAKIVVEYLPQAQIEGEIQNLNARHVYAELWELIGGRKPGRERDDEITVFDSVGFALEDYAALKYVYRLADELTIGAELPLIPDLSDPKNLFSLVK